MRLVTVDPGKAACGWAEFDATTLIACGFEAVNGMRNVFRRLHDENVCFDLIIERPQVYPHAKLRGDPNDLIDVALTAGAVFAMALIPYADFVRPRVWKGTRPKNIQCAAIEAALRPHERHVLDRCGLPSHKRHNVVDAIGIGLWKVGRGV